MISSKYIKLPSFPVAVNGKKSFAVFSWFDTSHFFAEQLIIRLISIPLTFYKPKNKMQPIF